SGCLAGEKEVFRLLYDKYAATMMGVCLRYARNSSDAEDVLQEGFIKVFDNLHQFKVKGSFEGWIRKIMVNAALGYYRTQSPLNIYTEIEKINEHPKADYIAMDSLETEELMHMINNLPTGCKTVFNMYAIDGYSHKEIAETLKISEGTSKSQLFDARKLLKKMIAKSLIVPPKRTE
ncbi:MAG: RNA polymerase sigma factor, partial [Bacteroidetes bacterium]|nr:RNA polymerase sigma factor [Bacteroidota bacterium]